MEKDTYDKMKETLISNLPDEEGNQAVKLSEVSEPLLAFLEELPESMEKIQAKVRIHEGLMWTANAIMKISP